MILWSNGETSHAGTTLAVGQYERAEWTKNHQSRVLVTRTWADAWQTGLVAPDHVSRFVGAESLYIVRAEVDATPDVVALAEAWRQNEAYAEAERREIARNCGLKPGQLALVCAHPWRGFVCRYDRSSFWSNYERAQYTQPYTPGEWNAVHRALRNIPLELVEVTGVAEGDQPDWAWPVTVVSNKSVDVGYAVVRRMARDPDLLARAEAHGRIAVEMAGQRLPTSWFKENNRLFGLESR